MPGKLAALFALILTAGWSAEPPDPCAAESSTSDVRFELELKDHSAVFQAGEIVPLQLSFSSSVKGRYTADGRNYDRSGRLGLEQYCVEPAAPDPLEWYYKSRGFAGGGIGTLKHLEAIPYLQDSELNEWRSLSPGHYRLYAISMRVSRPRDLQEDQRQGPVRETLRSNTIDFMVNAPNREWQNAQLQIAAQTLDGGAAGEAARHAARVLRFLNTEDSARELAKRFWGLNQQEPIGWDLMFGLFASPDQQVAIDAMHRELGSTGHAITKEFLDVLVSLQVGMDSHWDHPLQEDAQFYARRHAHEQVLMQAEVETTLASLQQKIGGARALTLDGLLAASEGNPEIVKSLRPKLIASWTDLPAATQRELIQFRWATVDSVAMAPILQKLLAEPPAPKHTQGAMVRDAALKDLHEIDPGAGREAILSDLRNPQAQPALDTIQLLPADDLPVAGRLAAERVASSTGREVDYQLIDRYADASALPSVRVAFEKHTEKWECALQAPLLRYFLRVAPEYGAQAVTGALRVRSNSGCYRTLLHDLGDQLPNAQATAIFALDDPDNDVAANAAEALGRWGSPDAEKALWARLRRFHAEWEGRQEELRSGPEFTSPGTKGEELERALAWGIAQGTNWDGPPEKLERLETLVWTKVHAQEIEGWIGEWKRGTVTIEPYWSPSDAPTFVLLQYSELTVEQLRTKVTQLPRNMALQWRFWTGANIPALTKERQEETYESVRAAAAKYGVVIGRGSGR